MSFKSRAMIATAVLVSASSFAAAAQAAVFLGFQHNGGSIVQVDTDPWGVSYAGAFGPFELAIFSGTDGVHPQLLASSGHARNSVGAANAGTLDVYVTVTDIASLADHFSSSFAVNVLPKKWTVTTRTYANADNALWGIGGALLSSHTFGGVGVYEDIGGAALGPGLYSVTARYTITAPTRGEALANASIAAVPEPGAWALMITGFGAVGSLLRRRRSMGAAAA